MLKNSEQSPLIALYQFSERYIIAFSLFDAQHQLHIGINLRRRGTSFFVLARAQPNSFRLP